MDCEKIYIGKSKRDFKTRVREHFRNIKNGELEKSAVWMEKHTMYGRPALLKQTSNKN